VGHPIAALADDSPPRREQGRFRIFASEEHGEFSIDTLLFSLYKTEDSNMLKHFNEMQPKEEAS